MTVHLTPQQQDLMDRTFGFISGKLERTYPNINMQLQLSGTIPEATLLHCGGAEAPPFWDARGLKGYSFDREKQKELQRQEVVKASSQVFTEEGGLRPDLLNPFLADAVLIFNQILSGADPFSHDALADKKVVLVLGFWRSMGTIMLWRVLRLMGVSPDKLNPFMMHDNMPDLGVLERSKTHLEGMLSAYFQFSQYLAWSKGAFSGHPVIVHKNSSHVYWLQSLSSILGNRAVYQFSIRHPVSSAVSLIGTFTKDIDYTLEQKTNIGAVEVWWKTVSRAFGMDPAEWENLTILEKAIEHWAAYHVLTELNGEIAKRMHVYRFGDDLEQFLAQSLPFTVDAPPDEDEKVSPSARDLDCFMTPSIIDRSERAMERARHHFATFGIQLPELRLA